MATFLAVSARADMQSITFVDAAGSERRIDGGGVRTFRRGPSANGDALSVDDGRGLVVIALAATFDAASVLQGRATGDRARDFESFVQGMAHYARGVPLEHVARIELPPPPSAGPTAPLAPFTLSAPRAPTPMPAKVGVGRPTRPAPAPATTCNKCNTTLLDAREHFLIQERPWCVRCGLDEVVPPAAQIALLLTRIAVVAAGTSTLWQLGVRSSWPIFVSGFVAAVGAIALGALLLVGLGGGADMVERRQGAPGPASTPMPLFTPAERNDWLRRRFAAEKGKNALQALVLVAFVALRAVGPGPAEFPQTLTWRELPFDRKITLTVPRTDVTIARYARPGRPGADAGAIVALMRGKTGDDETLRKVALANMWMSNAIVFSKKVEQPANACYILDERDRTLMLYVFSAPCRYGTCSAAALIDKNIGGKAEPCEETMPRERTTLLGLLPATWKARL